MFQELLTELVHRAHVEQSVAFASVGNGVQLLVYPLEHRMLVGVGLEGERALQMDANRLLRKRAGDMARFGSWLPARMKDGSWYVFKRVPVHDLDVPVLDQSDLDKAEELLR
jgi:hypothetical protein